LCGAEIHYQERYVIPEFQIQDTVRKLNQLELKIRGLLAGSHLEAPGDTTLLANF
jgi:hypothetical protein